MSDFETFLRNATKPGHRAMCLNLHQLSVFGRIISSVILIWSN